jgi:TRAP transporter 4TM/12TM fusion protein
MSAPDTQVSAPRDSELLVIGSGGSQVLKRIALCAAFLTTVVAILWSAGAFWRLGLQLYGEQPMSVILGLALVIIFLTIDYRGEPKNSVSYIDVGLAALSAAVFLYVALRYPQLTENLYFNPWYTFTVGGLVVLLTAEGMRRCAGGWSLLVIFIVFVIYALWGHLIPGPLQGRSTTLFRLLPILGLDSSAVFGNALEIVGTIVIAFILMGQFLYVTGGGQFFTDLSAALMRGQRGAAAKITVISSALFGTISGSVVANVTSSGIITIPMMKRSGFKAHVAGAIEAVASNGGQIMPPVMGAASFLMADYLGVPYSQIVLAASIPAALYFFAVFMHVDLEAAKHNIRTEDPSTIPPLFTILREGLIFLIPLGLLLVLMFQYNMAPETAALISTGCIIVLGFFKGYRGQRLKLSDIPKALVETGLSASQIIIICAIAGMLVSVMNVTGLDFALSLLLLHLGGGSLFILLLTTAVICIILGMSLPTTTLYILLATLIVPSLIKLGTLPIAAHMFVFYFGMMSFVTPPVAIASFTAANIAKADPMKTGWASCYFGWVAYVVPFLFVYSPALLAQGPVEVIIVTTIGVTVGIILISAGMMGYLRSHLSLPKRAVAFTVGAALMLPLETAAGGLLLEAVLILTGIALITLEVKVLDKSRSQVPA